MTIPFLVAMWKNPTTATYNRPSTSASQVGAIPTAIQPYAQSYNNAWQAGGSSVPANAYDVPAGGVSTLDSTSTGTTATLSSNSAANGTGTQNTYRSSGVLYSGFSGSGLTGTLYVQATSTTADNAVGTAEAVSTSYIIYSLDGGTTWTGLVSDVGSNSTTDISFSHAITVTAQSQLRVLVIATGNYVKNSVSGYIATADATLSTYDIVFVA